MRRRHVLSLLGGAALSVMSATGEAEARSRIAVLTLSTPKDEEHIMAAFVQGLRSRGYVEGKNLDIDYRYSNGDVTRLLPLARELLAFKPDVALGAEPSPAKALKSIAPTLPIVCATLTDAQIPELAASYARPGGSVTGIAISVEGVTGKLIELTQEFVPRALRIGFLFNPTGASMQFYAQNVEDNARQRGIALLSEQATRHEDIGPAFDHLVERKAEAVIVPPNGLFRNEAANIAQLAVTAHLPTIFAERHGVEVGGLASYGIDQRETYRRAADYIDKILKGAKPADMPIEFPTKIELLINLRTAKALGIDVPLFLQQRADEVIE
jgi:putative tryptophan/tyrosine transport system substrate-binding protein